MKKLHILIVLGLFVLAAAVWGSQLARWLTPAPNLTRYPLGPWYYCESCSWHFDENPRLVAPLKCPKCKKQTAMRTTHSPGSTAPEFVQCKKCQAKLPYQLFKWTDAEKVRWEKRLEAMDDGQLLTMEEMNQMQDSRLTKTLARPEWLTADETARLPAAQLSAVICSKCNNNDPAQFNYSVIPPGKSNR